MARIDPEEQRRLRKLHEQIEKLAKQWSRQLGMPITTEGIYWEARMVAQTDVDPLPIEDWGRRFEWRSKVAVIDDDFLCINAAVPPPNAQVCLRAAWKEFQHDIERAAAIFDRVEAGKAELSTARVAFLFRNNLDWMQFWAVRHPDPNSRAAYARRARAGEAAQERLVTKAHEAAARIGAKRGADWSSNYVS